MKLNNHITTRTKSKRKKREGEEVTYGDMEKGKGRGAPSLKKVGGDLGESLEMKERGEEVKRRERGSLYKN